MPSCYFVSFVVVALWFAHQHSVDHVLNARPCPPVCFVSTAQTEFEVVVGKSLSELPIRPTADDIQRDGFESFADKAAHALQRLGSFLNCLS